MAIGVQVWSQTASANSTSDTNINWAEGMAPSQVNDSARAEMASVAKWRDDNSGSLVTAGTTTAYTIAATNQIEAALTAGYTVAFQMHATNDSSATLAVDGLTAKPLQVIAGTNLAGGELLIGNVYRATYSTSGTGQWLIQGSDALGSQPNIVTTTNITAAAVSYAKIQNVAASRLLGNPTGGATAVSEISLGTNLAFSGTVLNAGNNTPVVSVFTSTGTATWQSTTQGGNFPLYLLVRMAGGGGGGGAASANNGSSGTDTSWASWTAIGGGKGLTANTGGAGGTGGVNSTGTLIRRLTGQAGGNGQNAVSGSGGNSALGGGGPVNTTGAGAAAVANTGSGGAGGGAGAAGGGGGAEYVEFLITSPSTSYSYTVGGPGAGGAAGGSAGGNGAAGRIEVISYWQ